MFKNLTAFHIGGTFDICLDAMDAALAKARFKPCGPTDEKSVGFVEPRGQNHGALIESAGCPMSRILRVRIDTKNVHRPLRSARRPRPAQITLRRPLAASPASGR